jgi:hypothetical protein
MDCKGKTAKNQPCSRKVKEGEYCFQHKVVDKVVEEKKEIKINEKIINNISGTTTFCIKIDNLRKHGYTDLRDWMSKDNNVYVGRRGRVFITQPDKSKEIFTYSGNKFANIYKVDKDGIVEEVCKKYRDYILHTPELLNSLVELKGKTLGCFCNQEGSCHAKILKALVDELIK